jgi:hypothetical protein
MSDVAPDLGRSDSVRIFEDRIILQPRAPITNEELKLIEARCAGPIPAELERLWRITFGGQLDYGLNVEFDGHVHEFSFTELFFPGSDHYHDLYGWMDHEVELAKEFAGGRDRSDALAFLPIGGFEYLERICVCTQPGDDYGAVFAYAQGLPPAWILNLHENSVARIADDLPSLFRMLDLPQDPRSVAQDDFAPGVELVATIQSIGEADPARAATLMRLVDAAVVDWRASLSGEDIASRPRHRRLALSHASATGDIGLLERLAALGCDLNERFLGGGGPLDHSLVHGRFEAARWLLGQGASVTQAVDVAAAVAPPDLIRELLERGAAPSARAATAAARAGHMESAQVIADALGRSDLSAVRGLIEDLAAWAGGADATPNRIASGELQSNRTSDEYESEGERMRALRNHCQSLLGPKLRPAGSKALWRRLLGR